MTVLSKEQIHDVLVLCYLVINFALILNFWNKNVCGFDELEYRHSELCHFTLMVILLMCSQHQSILNCFCSSTKLRERNLEQTLRFPRPCVKTCRRTCLEMFSSMESSQIVNRRSGDTSSRTFRNVSGMITECHHLRVSSSTILQNVKPFKRT